MVGQNENSTRQKSLIFRWTWNHGNHYVGAYMLCILTSKCMLAHAFAWSKTIKKIGKLWKRYFFHHFRMYFSKYTTLATQSQQDYNCTSCSSVGYVRQQYNLVGSLKENPLAVKLLENRLYILLLTFLEILFKHSLFRSHHQRLIDIR